MTYELAAGVSSLSWAFGGLGHSSGHHGLAAAELRLPLSFLRLRGDALGYYSQDAGFGSQWAGGVTVSAVLNPIKRGPVRPYLLAGGGAFTAAARAITPGWTLGAGIRVPVRQYHITVESRMNAFRNPDHSLVVPGMLGPNDATQYLLMPLSVGFHF